MQDGLNNMNYMYYVKVCLYNVDENIFNIKFMFRTI